MKVLNAYRIELAKLLKARGAFPDDLKDKILTHSQEYCDSLDQDLPIDSGWLPAAILLKNYIDGKPFESVRNSAKHWYIVELLCNGLGKQLSSNSWENASLHDFYSFDEFRMYFLGMDDLVRLRAPESNPVVFTIENRLLENAKLLIDKSSHSTAQKNQFLDWVQTTMDHGQDLILFSY
jgi:hypothetical protein